MKSKTYQRRQYKLSDKSCSRNFHKVAYDTKGLEDTEKVSLRLVKKADPYSSYVVNSLIRRTHTMRVVEDTGKRERMYPSARKNVRFQACSQKFLSEDTHDSSCKILTGYNDLKTSNERIVTTYALAESSEENNSDYDVCSVGSCSLNDWGQKGFSRDFTKYPCLRRDSLLSDAESRCCSYDKEDNCYENMKDKVEVSVHDLELHAYRSTLEALYVSGPLSWEKEELLTNLRITLHISTDEHLRELRNLISSGTSK